MSFKKPVQSYSLSVWSPNSPTADRYIRTMTLSGEFGNAFIYFAPEGAALGQSQQRSGQNIYDVYFKINAWDAIVTVLQTNNAYFEFHESDGHALIGTL